MQNLQNNWTPDYLAEYRKRMNLLRACTNNEGTRRAVMLHYAHHPIDWINDWAITYNPRVKPPLPKIMPFLLFPRQLEFIEFLHGCVNDKECGLVEKSRDIGATWLCCAYSIWLWLFISNASIGWGSRKEMLIDRLGDADSIFQKMRMILDNLPIWMLPEGFNLRLHATHMKILNPVNASTITGESGDNIGRGGRSLVYFKDESAHYARAELIEAALGDNTDVQIDISSVHGNANIFHRRRHAGETWQAGIIPTKGKTRVFIFDWRHHPGKTQAWYETRRAKAEAEGLLHLFAQEVDRDYSASLDRIIIPQIWVKASIDAHLKLNFSDEGRRFSALDVADEGGDKNAQATRFGVVLQACDEWAEGDTGVTSRRALQTCKELKVNELYYDSIGVGAGVKAETNRLLSAGEISHSLRIMPWNAASGPMNPESRLIPGDSYSPRNIDFFANMKAQGWWKLRVRFEKTYKAITQGIVYPSDELISLDSSSLTNLHEIVIQLSQPTQKTSGSGKMLVDKKPDGTRSPNLADAIMMCYCPLRPNSFFSF